MSTNVILTRWLAGFFTAQNISLVTLSHHDSAKSVTDDMVWDEVNYYF